MRMTAIVASRVRPQKTRCTFALRSDTGSHKSWPGPQSPSKAPIMQAPGAAHIVLSGEATRSSALWNTRNPSSARRWDADKDSRPHRPDWHSEESDYGNALRASRAVGVL